MRGFWFDHNSGNCRFNKHYQNTGAAPFSGDWGKVIGKRINGKIYIWSPYYTFVPDFAVNYYKYSAETNNRHAYMDAATIRANADQVISVYLRDSNNSKQWGAFYRVPGQLVPRLPESDPKCVPDPYSGNLIFYYYSNPYKLQGGVVSSDAWGIVSNQSVALSSGYISYSDLDFKKLEVESKTHTTPSQGWLSSPIGDDIGGFLAPRVYVWVFYTTNSYKSDTNPDETIYINPTEGNARDVFKDIEARNLTAKGLMSGSWILRDYATPFAYSQSNTGTYTRYGGIGDHINKSYVNIKNYVPATICGPNSRYDNTTRNVLGISNIFSLADLSTDLPANTSWTVLPSTAIEIVDPNEYVAGASWGQNIKITGVI